MDLETFESDINPIIVARGRDYCRTGRIGDVTEIAPQLFHASVDGTTRYDVDIRMKGDRIVSAACSCPYDGGPYCKHIAAALMKMRDNRCKKQAPSPMPDDSDTDFPHETYDRVLAHLVSKHGKASGNPTANRKHKARNRTAPAMSLAAAAEKIEDGLLDFQAIWDDRWSDRHGHCSYEDNRIAMAGVRSVADNIERCDDDVQACLLALLALGYVINFISGWDDSDGIAGDEMERLESLLADRCGTLAAHPSAMLKLQVAHALVAAAENPAYGGWGAQTSFITHAETLVSHHDDVRFVLVALERLEADSTYEADKLVPAHYRLLVKLGQKKAIRAFEKAHALHPLFFTEKLEAVFLGHDMATAREMLMQKTGWEHSERKTVRHMAYADWSLPHEVFPNGYYTYLEAVFEEQQDREALLALYRKFVDDGHMGPEMRKKLRRLAGQDWPSERDKVIEAAIESNRHSSAAEEFIRADNLADAALRYCQAESASPYGYPSGRHERILSFYRLVGEAYPDETRAMLLQLIEAKSQRSTGREVYREICGIIQRYQSLFGTEDAREIVTNLRTRYARRRNLLEELDSLEASW